MNPDCGENNREARRRRFVVHLSCLSETGRESGRYFARIRPSTARSGAHTQFGERAFEDDCELIAVINPLLPPGSDVRDIFAHIDTPNGFFYVLWLTHEEARQLGWNG